MSISTDGRASGLSGAWLALFLGFCLMLMTASASFAINAKVTSYKLDNGMEVVVIPDHRAPVVTHMVWYRVGSADEPRGKAGIAHYLEHLLFKGTDKIPSGEFSKIVKRNGGQDNAFTSRDFTAYYQRISKDRLEMVMSMEADRISNLTLEESDVKTELEVVREERRSRTDNKPTSLLGEQIDAVLYLAHPYRKPVIGWMDEVARLTRDDAMEFYRTYYTPSNAILVVAGDVTVDEVRKLAARHYAPLKNTANPGRRIRTEEPKPLAARRIDMFDARVSEPVFQRDYLTVSYTTADKREAEALDIVTKVFGGGATSRLYRELVVKQKLASNAGAWFGGEQRDNGSVTIYATPARGVDLARLEAAIDSLIDDLVTNGITADELKRARDKMIADSVYDLDSQFRLAYMFGSALTSGRTVDDVLQWTSRMETVTLDDVKAAVAKALKIEASVTGYLRKERPGMAPKQN